MAQFTDDKKLQNSFFHSLSKTATEGTQSPYESSYKSAHSIFSKEVFTDEIDFAADQAAADLFVTNNPSKIKKYVQFNLTMVAGSNSQAWYINDGGSYIRPFILPTDIMDTSGNISYGYDIKLYKQDGTLISPTMGAWNIDGYSGLILFNPGYTPVELGYGIPKITCYTYIGKTLKESLGGIINGTTWQNPVNSASIVDPTTLTPSDGDRYIIPTGAINDWLGYDNNVAVYNVDHWEFSIQQKGWTIYVLDINRIYNYNGIEWVNVGGNSNAVNVYTNTTNFTKILSPVDDNVQKALDTLDKTIDDTLLTSSNKTWSIDKISAKFGEIAKPLILKGDINIAADFPTLTVVKEGWTYLIKSNVTDNDGTKTNTLQAFKAGDEIAWNGTNWTELGSIQLFVDTGSEIKAITSRDINLQSNGLKDSNVTTAVKLGDVLNTSFNTANKTIIGSLNEVNERAKLSSIGVITLPTLTKNGDGTVTIGNDGVCVFNSLANGLGDFLKLNCSTGATLTMTDESVNYIYCNYNNGSPAYSVSTDGNQFFTNATYIPITRVTREGTTLHFEEYDQYGTLLSNKLLFKDVVLHAFERQSGLTLSTTATRIASLSAGVAWFGVQNFNMPANTSGTSGLLYEYYLSSGVWLRNLVTSYDSVYYSDGTNRLSLNNNKYVSKYFFRDVGSDNEMYYFHGDSYNSEAEAYSEAMPNISSVVSAHSIYVGKIVIQKDAVIGKAFPRLWEGATTSIVSTGGTGTSDHESLTNLYGGGALHYHSDQPINITDDVTFNTIKSTVMNDTLSNLASNVENINGVPDNEKSKWSFSYNATTRVFTVTLSSTSYFYVTGKRHNVSAGTYTTAAHTNTNGNWYLYYDSLGVLTVSSTPWDIFSSAQLYMVYYISSNVLNSNLPDYIPYYELHGTNMTSAEHYYNHVYSGTKFGSGAALSGYTIQSDTTANTTYAIASSTFSDEDINLSATAQSESNYFLGYFDASGNFNWSYTNALPFFIGAGSNIQYNQIGTGLTELTVNNTYVNYYIFAINHYDNTKRYLIIPGQATYTALASAQAETVASLNLQALPIKEFVGIWQITFRRSSTYSTTTGRSRIEAQPVRLNVNSATITGFSGLHNNLAGRSDANAHPASSIYGITSYSIPFVSSIDSSLIESSYLTFNDTTRLLSTGSVGLNNTTFASQYGVIYKGSNRFLHDFNYGSNGTVVTAGKNTFVGELSGNFTMGAIATNPSYSSYNVGIGYQSLYGNTNGYENVAVGYQSLYTNTTGNSITAVGGYSMYFNTTGINNTAIGKYAMYSNSTGNNNTAIGAGAGNLNSAGNINPGSSNCVYIGMGTRSYADGDTNEVVIGYTATGNGSNTVTIGNSSHTHMYLYGMLKLNTGTISPITNSTASINFMRADGVSSVMAIDTLNDKILPRSIDLPLTTFTSQYGIIYKASTRFFHDFNYGNNGTVTTRGFNIFLGNNSGNFTMGTTATNVLHSSYNVGIGENSFSNNTIGYYNTSLGAFSSAFNTTGYSNVSIGTFSSYNGTTGNYNVSVGYNSLYYNQTCSAIVSVGSRALLNLNSGNNNVGIGNDVMYNPTTVISTIAIGDSAASKIVGGANASSLTNGIFIGNNTAPKTATSVNEIIIGYNGQGNGDNTITIGNSSHTNTYLYGILKLFNGRISPVTDSTSAIQFTKADGTTSLLTLDTANNILYNYTQLNSIVDSNSYLNSFYAQNLNSGSSAGASIQIANNSGLSGYILMNSSTNTSYGGASSFNLGTSQALPMTLLTNNIVRMTISSAGLISLSDSLNLNNTTFSSQTGIIYKNNARFIHNFSYGSNGTTTPVGRNIFIGEEAGNFTLGSTAQIASESSHNIGIGYQSLLNVTRGDNNIAIGSNSLYLTLTNEYNIAIGRSSLYNLSSGNSNTAIGHSSGQYVVAGTANSTANGSVFIGADTRASASGNTNEIVIGNSVYGNGSNTVTIGNSNITNNYFKGILTTQSDTIASAGLTIYNYANGSGSILGYGMGGTATSPSTTLTGNILLLLSGRGHNSSTILNSSKAQIKFVASEDWTTTANGAYISFLTTPSTTTTQAEYMRLNADGKLTVGSGTAGTKNLNVIANDGNGMMIKICSDTSSNYPDILSQASRGTISTPTATQSGDTLLRMAGAGHTSAAFATRAIIQMRAAETWTTTAQGTYISFQTTQSTTTTTSEVMRLNNNGIINILSHGSAVCGTLTMYDTSIGIWRGSENTVGGTGGNWLNLGGYDGISFSCSNNAIGSQTSRMRISSAGSVLIGTTEPIYDTNSGGDVSQYYSFQATGKTYSTRGLTLSNDNVGSDYGFWTINSASKKVRFAAIRGEITTNTAGSEAGYLSFRTMSGGATAAERMKITEVGNIGIGASTPNAWLSIASLDGVNQQIYASSGYARMAICSQSNDPEIHLVRYANSANDRAFRISMSATGLIIDQPSDDYQSSTHCLTLSIGGFIGVNRGSSVASASTITPTGVIFHITGTTAINTINVPYSGFNGSIVIIPDNSGLSFTTSGNIATAISPTINIAVIFTYYSTTAKWYYTA